MPKFKDFSNNHNLNDAKNLTWEAAEESLDGFPNLSGGNIAGDVTVNFPLDEDIRQRCGIVVLLDRRGRTQPCHALSEHCFRKRGRSANLGPDIRQRR